MEFNKYENENMLQSFSCNCFLFKPPCINILSYFKFWTQPFLSNSSSVKALNKYPFVSIDGNLWKYLNIFVSIFILSGVLPSFDKTLILVVNFLTPNICLHIDIWNCSILFAKISFFIESPQHIGWLVSLKGVQV